MIALHEGLMDGGCPKPDLLTDLVVGRLSSDQIAQISRHVSTCKDCEVSLVELAAVVITTKLPPGIPGLTPDGNPVNFVGKLYAVDKGRERCDSTIAHSHRLRFKPAGFAGGSWRRISLDVTPERLTAYWDDGVFAGEIRVAAICEDLDRETTTKILRDAPHSPARTRPRQSFVRGGIGLYVLKGSASFRTISIEPISLRPSQ